MGTQADKTEAHEFPVLGIDTCGPAGSVALARVTSASAAILGEAALEGRTYSTTLISAIERLLTAHTTALRDLACIIVVNGPGSFTGVRVGLSAAKGLAEGAGLPLVAVSRLEVLAHTAAAADAALDAHRHEVFLRAHGRELLAGAPELAAVHPAPTQIAVCDDAAATVLQKTWPSAEILHVSPPTAADAIHHAAPQILARNFADVLLLDGHYLRRSDAEIFGDPASAAARK